MKFYKYIPKSREEEVSSNNMIIIAFAGLFLVSIIFLILEIHQYIVYSFDKDYIWLTAGFSAFFLGAVIYCLVLKSLYPEKSELDGWKYMIVLKNGRECVLTDAVEIDDKGNAKVCLDDEFVYKSENEKMKWIPYECICIAETKEKIPAEELAKFRMKVARKGGEK